MEVGTPRALHDRRRAHTRVATGGVPRAPRIPPRRHGYSHVHLRRMETPHLGHHRPWPRRRTTRTATTQVQKRPSDSTEKIALQRHGGLPCVHPRLDFPALGGGPGQNLHVQARRKGPPDLPPRTPICGPYDRNSTSLRPRTDCGKIRETNGFSHHPKHGREDRRRPSPRPKRSRQNQRHSRRTCAGKRPEQVRRSPPR